MEAQLAQWTRQVAGLETMVSWILLGYPSNPKASWGSMMDDYEVVRGLDPERQICKGHAQMVAVLTSHQLLLGAVGGVLRVKPKDVIAAAALDDVRVEWWDESKLGPDERHMLFVLGPDWVPTSAMIRPHTNADDFLRALGSKAVAVDPSHPPA
jgi:hypothetical protein